MDNASTTTIALNAQTVATEAGSTDVPQWVHLLPTASGEVQTGDKRGPYHVVDADQIIAASFAETDRLPIDENHAIDLAAPKGLPAPARGWITEMQSRTDGIWGLVEWSDKGRDLLMNRAYRALSPVITHTKEKTVGRILRASLVNRPNLRGLVALNQENDEMSLTERLAELLGLGPEASEDDLINALKTKLETEGGEDKALQSQMSEVAVALGLAEDAEHSVVLNAAQNSDGDDQETVVALQAQLNDTVTKLNELTDDRKREKATGFVDAAITAGRVGVKPRRDAYISRHMEDPEATEADINAIPVLGPSGLTDIPPPSGETISLNAEELAAEAVTFQAERAKAGQTITMTAAVQAVQESKA